MKHKTWSWAECCNWTKTCSLTWPVMIFLGHCLDWCFDSRLLHHWVRGPDCHLPREVQVSSGAHEPCRPLRHPTILRIIRRRSLIRIPHHRKDRKGNNKKVFIIELFQLQNCKNSPLKRALLLHADFVPNIRALCWPRPSISHLGPTSNVPNLNIF